MKDLNKRLIKPPDSKVVEWFKSRGISQKTLTDLRVGEGTEYMPQTGKPENTIKFNYFMGGDLLILNTAMEERTLNYIRVLKNIL